MGSMTLVLGIMVMVVLGAVIGWMSVPQRSQVSGWVLRNASARRWWRRVSRRDRAALARRQRAVRRGGHGG